VGLGITRVTVIAVRAAEPGVLLTAVPVCWHSAAELGIINNPTGKTILRSVTSWTLTNFGSCRAIVRAL